MRRRCALDAKAARGAVTKYWDVRTKIMTGESNDLNSLAEVAQDEQLDIDQPELQKFRSRAIMVGAPAITTMAAVKAGDHPL